jgi:hypothetical protein
VNKQDRDEDEYLWKRMFELPVDATDEEIWIGFCIMIAVVGNAGLLLYAFY